MTRHSQQLQLDDLQITDILRLLWVGRWTIAVTALIGVVLGAIYVFGLATPRYAAETKINVRAGFLLAARGVPFTVENEDIIGTSILDLEQQRATSFDMLRKVVTALELTKDPEFNPGLTSGLTDRIFGAKTLSDAEQLALTIETLGTALSAAAPKDTEVLTLTLRAKDPHKAAKILNKLSDFYLLSHARSYMQAAGIRIPSLDNDSDPEGALSALLQSTKDLAAQIEVMGTVPEDEIHGMLETLLGISQAALISYGAIVTRTEIQLLYQPELTVGLSRLFASVLQPAIPPREPTSPRVALTLGLMLVLGALAGAIFVLVRGLTQVRIYDAGTLRDLFGLPVIGQLPAKGNDPKAYSALRSTLLLTHMQNPAKVILMISATPDVSLDAQALALAQSYADLGKRVVILDADLRHSRLRARAPQTAPDLTQVLGGEVGLKDAIQPIDGVDVILGANATGASGQDISGLFSAPSFGKMLTELRDQTDVVVIAAPSIQNDAEAVMLEPLSDTCLLAVSTGQTLVSDITSTLTQLHLSGRDSTRFVLLS